MPTREELLMGVTKVNHERIDSKNVAQSIKAEVPESGNVGRNGAPSVNKRSSVPAAKVVQGGQETVDEFVSRRTTECRDALEEVKDQLAIKNAEITGLTHEADVINYELIQLEAMANLVRTKQGE